jgi:hypothetical protein
MIKVQLETAHNRAKIKTTREISCRRLARGDIGLINPQQQSGASTKRASPYNYSLSTTLAAFDDIGVIGVITLLAEKKRGIREGRMTNYD